MLDPASDTPVYVQLADIIRAQIRSGELPPRRAIPSIRMLQQTYEVSDGTVQKAVAILRAEGLVRSVAGKGVFVVPAEERPRPEGDA